jgi:DNA-binding response OmpR family regulator
LPRAEGDFADSVATLEETPLQGTETILLVEDDPSIRGLAEQILRTQGYSVLSARDGENALEVAARHNGPVDLLLTDVVMPRLGGGELAARLTTERPGLKVLYLSGYTDDAVVRHGVLREEAAFLHKPFTIIALAKKVRAVLDGTPSDGVPR